MVRKKNSAVKINNHSIDTNTSDKKETNENEVKLLFLGEYFNLHTFQMHPITRNFIIQEALRLKQWADLDDSLRIRDFFNQRGYVKSVYYGWVADYPEMSIADEYALSMIASRREQGAMTRKFDGTTIHKTLGHYDHIWREELKLANEARLAIAEKSSSQVVVIERFPSVQGNLQDVEVVSLSSKTPEEIAGNIHRNTGTSREVKVNMDFERCYEQKPL